MNTTQREPRPKAEARRQQILNGAAKCARRAGFHGASMAEIAQASGVSVGQIYRYFENKEAIIAALVAQDADDKHGAFAEFESSDAPLAEAVIAQTPKIIDHCYDPAEAALLLEIMAEAARNPRVAEIVRAADVEERKLRRHVLQRAPSSSDGDAELLARAEVLAMLYDGMMIRGVSNPEGDREAISRVVRSVLRHLLTESLSEPHSGEAAGG